MLNKVKQIMISTGTHKYISTECQNRIDIITEQLIQECLHILSNSKYKEAANFLANHFEIMEMTPMQAIKQFNHKNRSAHIYERHRGYRVVCLDSYQEHQSEEYTDTIENAESIAEDWVNYSQIR